MAVFLFLGAAAAMLNVFRLLRGLDNTIGLGRATLAADSRGKTNNSDGHAWEDEDE